MSKQRKRHRIGLFPAEDTLEVPTGEERGWVSQGRGVQRALSPLSTWERTECLPLLYIRSYCNTGCDHTSIERRRREFAPVGWG